MADISLSSQQLVKALSQLKTSADSNPVARQAVQVLVQQLQGPQLQLSANGQRAIIHHDRAKQSGQIQNGQHYQVRMAGPRQQPVLQFFAPQTPLSAENLLLDPNQLGALSKAPVNNITPGQIWQALKAPVVAAVIRSVSAQHLILDIAGNNKSAPPVTLPLDKPQPALRPGQQVQIQLSASQGLWKIQLQPVTDTASSPSATAPAKDKPASQPGSAAGTTPTTPPKPGSTIASSVKPPADIPGHIPQGQVVKPAEVGLPAAIQINPNRMTVVSLVRLLSAMPSVASLPVASAEINKQQLTQVLQGQNAQAMLTLLKQTPAQKLPVQITESAQLRLNLHPPQAQIALDSSQLGQLKSLNIPLSTKAQVALPQMPAQQATVQLSASANVSGETPSKQFRPTIVPLPANAAQQQVVEQLRMLLRQVTPIAASPADVLQPLFNQLTAADTSVDKPSKQWLEQTVNQIKATLPQGNDRDSNLIKQWLATPALPISPAQVISPIPTQGMLSGLVTLLQVSLASRLHRQHAGQQERIAQAVESLLGNNKTNAKPVASRLLQDVGQLEQRHNMLHQLGRMLAGHQATKLTNAENALQGQDGWYFALPGMAVSGRVNDIELMIRRQPEQEQGEKAKAGKGKLWHLTVKLGVGELGEMLAKARLTDDYLEVDFYTSNTELKNKVLEWLPYLDRRFKQLGIEVGQSSCQLGKIPDSLKNRPYQILETRA